MAKPLSYQNLKCVFEYLEANKRIHITNRCPVLRKMERKIPLHLDSLTFEYSSITLNDITFQLYTRVKDEEGYYKNVPYAVNRFNGPDDSADHILLPGDIPLSSIVGYTRAKITSGNRPVHPIFLYFKKGLKRNLADHRAPEHLEFHVAMKRLATFLLGTRSQIIVKHLKVDDSSLEVLLLPLGLKLTPQELEINSDHFENLMPLINSKSLKSLKIKYCYWNDPCFEHSIVRSVQQLYIKGFAFGETSWNKTLLELPNRDITLDWPFSIGEFRDFIQGLLDEGRDIGTCYRINNWASFVWGFKDIGERFGVKVFEEWSWDLKCISYSLSIPMTATTELRLRGNSKQCKACTKIEVVPITLKKECPDGCWVPIFFLILFFSLLLIMAIF